MLIVRSQEERILKSEILRSTQNDKPNPGPQSQSPPTPQAHRITRRPNTHKVPLYRRDQHEVPSTCPQPCWRKTLFSIPTTLLQRWQSNSPAYADTWARSLLHNPSWGKTVRAGGLRRRSPRIYPQGALSPGPLNHQRESVPTIPHSHSPQQESVPPTTESRGAVFPASRREGQAPAYCVPGAPPPYVLL